jgi:hypothetical protein
MIKNNQKLFNYKNIDFLINKRLGYKLPSGEINKININDVIDKKSLFNKNNVDNISVTVGKVLPEPQPLQIVSIENDLDLVTINNENIVTIENYA